jgi:hypothetical protein
VRNLSKEYLFYIRNRAEAAEPEYPCCLKFRTVTGQLMEKYIKLHHVKKIMKRPCLSAIILSFVFSIISCSQPGSKKIEQSSLRPVIIDTSRIAIIPFDQADNWPFDNRFKPSTLSSQEIIEVDSLLKACVANYNIGLSKNLEEYYSIDFQKYKYKFQYVAAINGKGEKEVWINGFCNTWDTHWKKEILFVKDGGNCYFNLKFNLSTKECFEVAVNGYA